MDDAWGWFGTGFVIAVIGGVGALVANDSGHDKWPFLGLAVAGIGGLVTLVGVVALGVSVGTRHAARPTPETPEA